MKRIAFVDGNKTLLSRQKKSNHFPASCERYKALNDETESFLKKIGFCGEKKKMKIFVLKTRRTVFSLSSSRIFDFDSSRTCMRA